MLVLSRKAGESVLLIHDGIRIGSIRIVEVRGSKIRIGFDLDASISAIRSELLDDIGRAALPAADSDNLQEAVA